jgi:hypothetical protein
MCEVVFSELGVAAPRPVVRAVGIAVMLNPFAGWFVDDLQPLFEAGATIGERLMPDLVRVLNGLQSRTARVHSSASMARSDTAALASTRCSSSRRRQR